MKPSLRLAPFCIAALLASQLSSAQTTAPAATQAATGLTVAVLDFTSSVPGSTDLGPQVSEGLTALLGGDDAFTLVDRATLARTLQEHELSLTGLTNPQDAVRVGNLVGAKILVTGKVFALDKSLFLTAKIIGTETSLVEGVLVKGKLDAGVSELFPQLAGKIAEKIKSSGSKLVAGPEAMDPIPGLQQKLSGKTLPRLTISVREQHHGEAPRPIDPAVETELRVVLQKAGFALADPATAGRNDYDVAIDGEAFSEFAGRIGNLVTCTARAELKVTDRKTGKLIYSDRTTTRAADLSENIAGKAALQKAGHELGVRLLQFYAEPASATQPAR